MRGVGRTDNHKLDIARQQLIDRAVDRHTRVGRASLRAIALHDRSQLQSGHRMNKRRMKHPAGKAETNHTCTNRQSNNPVSEIAAH